MEEENKEATPEVATEATPEVAPVAELPTFEGSMFTAPAEIVETEVAPATKQAAETAQKLAKEREAQVFKETETKFAEEATSTESISEREARRKLAPVTPEVTKEIVITRDKIYPKPARPGYSWVWSYTVKSPGEYDASGTADEVGL